MFNIIKYLKEVKNEIKYIEWPALSHVLYLLLIIIISISLLALLLLACDYLSKTLITFIVNI